MDFSFHLFSWKDRLVAELQDPRKKSSFCDLTQLKIGDEGKPFYNLIVLRLTCSDNGHMFRVEGANVPLQIVLKYVYGGRFT